MSLRVAMTFGLPIRGIIHIGASHGQEIAAYRSETNQVLYIEAIPDLAAALHEKVTEMGLPFTVQQACCSNVSGQKVQFNVTSGGGESSSILPLGRHAEMYPGAVVVKQLELETITLDDLISQHPEHTQSNMLVIDTQGADLMVLQGASDTIARQIDGIYVEVSVEPLYEGGARLEEITAFMQSLGFSLTTLGIGLMGWGNALYLRDTPIIEQQIVTSLSAGKPARQSSTQGQTDMHGPGKAVTGVFRQELCSRTRKEQDPWWMVDLEALCDITEVVVVDRFRRRPAFPLLPLMIEVSADAQVWQKVGSLNETEQQLASFSRAFAVPVAGQGRYLRIRAEGELSLSLSQVHVYGSPAV